MKAIKIFGAFSAVFCLLTMTGYDCPTTDVAAQMTATIISGIIAAVCGVIVAKHQQ